MSKNHKLRKVYILYTRITYRKVIIMASYRINGGKRLEGEIDISGSKNASLPIIAACLLNKGITKLYNVPNIHDVQIMLKILKVLGCKIKKIR